MVVGLVVSCGGSKEGSQPNESEKAAIELVEKTTDKLEKSIEKADSEIKNAQMEIDSLLNNIK